uniref:Myb-like domain-containing protein n=1 Tax=Salix viminalis TaxID=40686 RepID=A0A6N2LEI0_SALVM
MIQKRAFADDNSYEVARKYPRKMEHIDQLAPTFPLDNAHQKHLVSGDHSFGEHQDVGRSASDSVTEISNGTSKEFETGDNGCFPQFLWISNGFLEDDNLSYFPEYFDHGHQLRALLEPDEACSSLDYPLRKSVSIGPEHQANVPEWGSQGSSTSLNQIDECNLQVARAQSSSPGAIIDGCYEENLRGTCVLPIPEQEASANYCYEATKGDCGCPDPGSIRCIKQHVSEARLKLRENLGEEIFEGLGFCDMGEVVANKWTAEEEQIFHEVVLSNPVSSGKNFWDNLSATFPSRTKKELVNYYFNVFMLRKRAEQNRFDPLNIDSDDDEWQRIGGETVGNDEGSAVESLTGQDSSVYCQDDQAENWNEYVEDEDGVVAFKDGVDNVALKVATDEEYEGDVDDFSGVKVGIYHGDHGGDLGHKHISQTSGNYTDDFDVQDDSCTSYDHHQDSIDCCGPCDIGADGRHCS